MLQDDMLKATPEIRVSQLPYPIKVRVNSKGEIFALDGKQRRIVRLTADGAFAGFVEPQGMPAAVPRSFAFDSTDNVYILDVKQEQVIVIDAAGKVINTIPLPQKYGFFSDIAVDAKGNVLLLDSVKSMVYMAARQTKTFQPFGGSMREYLDFAADLTTDSHGRSFLIDQNGGAVIVLGQDGSFQGRQLNLGRKSGLMYYPAQACVTDSGDFFVADRNNSRIQFFKLLK
jgi:streptogramin lyase